MNELLIRMSFGYDENGDAIHFAFFRFLRSISCQSFPILQGGDYVRRKYLALVLVSLVIIITGCVFVNRLPVWSTIEDLTENIGSLIEIDLTDYCTDPDGDEISFSLVSGPGSINGSNYSWIVSGAVGIRDVEIEASDGEGKSSTNFTITVKGPPNTPSNPSPSNNAVNQNFPIVKLSWESADPDGDEVTYDLYFGTSPDPDLFRENFSSLHQYIVELKNSTTYYWKIVAKDGTHEVEGPLWCFTTKAFYLVQETFESLPLGPLTSSALSWGTYSKASTSYAEITERGFNEAKGLTFVDPTVLGYAKVVGDGFKPASSGVIKFDFRVSENGFFGVGDPIRRAPYVYVGDFGDGFGVHTYNYQTDKVKKRSELEPDSWHMIMMEFDFNDSPGFAVYVDNVMHPCGYESYSESFDFTKFEFIVFSDRKCAYVDFDNIIICVTEPGYSAAGH